MVKLYYSSSSCSAACFIAATANFVNLDVEAVDLAARTTASGRPLSKIHAKADVPALVFDDGRVLCETSTALLWIADVSPGQIAPKAGCADRYALHDALSLIATLLHAPLDALRDSSVSVTDNTETERALCMQRVSEKLAFIAEKLLFDRKWVVTGRKTIADYYLFACLSYAITQGVDLAAWPVLTAYCERIARLQEVKDAKRRMAAQPAKVLEREFYSVQCVCA